MSACPSEEQLARFAAGACEAEEAAALDTHVSGCEQCRAWLKQERAAGAWLDGLRGAAASSAFEARSPGTDSRSPDAQASTRELPGAAAIAPPRLNVPGCEIIRELGHGGQGVVYEAFETATKRNVAVKVLLSSAYGSRSARKRFEREIELVAQLRHPNIIAVHHADHLPDGRPYYLMDYTRGLPLHEFVRRNKLALEDTLRLFATICDAVQYAHQRSVIHRDLKPTNIIVDADGMPRVLDFGLAKTIEAPAESLVTISQNVIGTLPYMSPEQAAGDGDAIDTRTDIYALGVILYELLTGAYPYPVDGRIPEVLRNITETPPAPPSRTWSAKLGITQRSRGRLRAGSCPIDKEVETIVLKALAKERERRYQSAGELAADARHYLAGEPIDARRDSALYVLRKSLRRYRIATIAAAVLMVVILGASIVSTTFWRRAEHEKTKASRLLYNRSIELAGTAYDEGNAAKMKSLLAECPEELRAWEWQRLNWQSDRSVAVLSEHNGQVQAVDFSPDGQRLLSAGDDGKVCLWDVHTGHVIRVLGQHVDDDGPCPALDARFSPDGKLAASVGYDNKVRLWDVDAGREVRSFSDTVMRNPLNVIFSRDGRRIAAVARDSTLRVWRIDTGKLLNRVPAHRQAPRCMVSSPDGRYIATASESGVVKLWNAATGTAINTIGDYGESISSLAFDSAGDRLAIAVRGRNFRSLRLCDPLTGVEAWSVTVSPDGVMSVEFTADDRLIVAGCHDHTLRLIDPATGELVHTLRGHEAEVIDIAVDPQGVFVASSSIDGTIRLWPAEELDTALTLAGHYGEVRCVAVSPNGLRIVSAGNDNTLKLWNSTTGEELRTLRGHTGKVTCAAWSPDGRHVFSAAADRDRQIRCWDVTTGQAAWVVPEASRETTHWLAVSPNGQRLISGDDEGILKVWDATSGQLQSTHDDHIAAIWKVAFRADGDMFASAGRSGRVILWDAESGRTIRSWQAHDSVARAVAFSPDGRHVLTGGQDYPLKLWDVAGGDLVRQYQGHQHQVQHVAFSPDGRRIVSSDSQSTIRIWDVDTGEIVLELDGHRQAAGSVEFTPDGASIVSGSQDGTIRIWETVKPSLEIARRRHVIAAARRVVDALHAELMFSDTVRQRVREDQALTDPVRTAALRLVDVRGDNWLEWNNAAWDIVRTADHTPPEYAWALKLAQAAVRERPDGASYLNTLGVAQFRNGEYEAAIVSLLRSEELFAEAGPVTDASNQAVLALAYAKIGRDDEANTALDKAMDRVEPNLEQSSDTGFVHTTVNQARALLRPQEDTSAADDMLDHRPRDAENP